MGVVVVTGANGGIGLELCRQLEKRGDSVVAVCRASSSELDGLGVRVVAGVDVAKHDTIAHLVTALDGESVDLLINNAGVLTNESWGDLDFDRMRWQYEVNTLGPLAVTSVLRDSLHSGSKVVIITSRVGSLDDNGSGGMYGYRVSKAGVNMVGVNLAHDLRDSGIAVALLHPGLVATKMTGGRGIAPSESVAGLLQRIDELTLERSGGFWHANGERLPW